MPEVLTLKSSRIYGIIEPVSLDKYDEIVNSYVEKICRLPAVDSIIQMGSYSAPGLSDIDLIVTIDESKPLPKWEELSLIKMSQNLEGREVVAHDIFCIPVTMAKRISGYFYVDKQIVHYGKELNSNKYDKMMIERLQKLVFMDYLIFNFVNLFETLKLKSIQARRMALFVSTFRHTYSLAQTFGLSDKVKRNIDILEIENFRQRILEGSFKKASLGKIINNYLIISAELIRLLGTSLGLQDDNELDFYPINHKKSYLAFAKPEIFVELFQIFVNQQRKFWAGKYYSIIPIPKIAISHIAEYCMIDDINKARLNKPLRIKCDNKSNKFLSARKERLDIVIDHWDFLNRTNYRASGRAYIGVEDMNHSIEGFSKRVFRGFCKKRLMLNSKKLIVKTK